MAELNIADLALPLSNEAFMFSLQPRSCSQTITGSARFMVDRRGLPERVVRLTMPRKPFERAKVVSICPHVMVIRWRRLTGDAA